MDDYSTGSLGAKAHFVHEMTHVWQVQREGWNLESFSHNLLGANEAYRALPGQSFNSFNYEAQAAMVSHYFVYTQGGTPQMKGGGQVPSQQTLKSIIPFAK